MALARSAALAESRREAGGREPAARPPACTGCVRGLGTRVPPTTAAPTRLPGQAPGHSLPAFLLPPPSSLHSPPASDPQTESGADPGVLLPEPEYCPPWRSPKKESPKISQRWRESKPRGNLTYHQYMPPEPRQGSRADPQAEGSALGPPGPPLWEGTDSQQPHPRMKPCVLTPCPPGVPSPSPPPHKLELQTLKLEELTVSELRQQLRLRGLPVSGTKSMLLERMRGGAPPRERPKPRREDTPAGAPWPRLRPKALAAARRQGSVKPSAASHRPPLPRAVDTPGTAPAPTTTSAPAAAPALNPSSAPGSPALTLEEELQEAIRRAQLLPNRDIDDILEDQVEPDDPLPPIPLDFPGSFDVLSPSPDSEGLSSVFSSSLPSPTNSSSPSPRDPTDSLDWLEALSGGPPLGSGPPPPSIFSADLSDSSSSRLWDLLEDPW
ncbi:MEF2-activating motif and SAP domain-containing transcriptional regulator isoform X12 [Macaca fascicularis]|uniref:MEF2-activating motif and SAP domain-containing transcriptional regulator isoform X12 n=1 Tax=Macaca fascicularis TaxID=9541 RepID=UPI0003AB5B41|nr:PREDICTED: MEF2-activating motif and SAP domain-containing transcriptional regulator isoform X8 [Macaca fascicularis]